VSFTIVVTVYNRSDIVCEAIGSAIEWASRIGCDIVVVDDGSTDRSLDCIKLMFADEISRGLLSCVGHPRNLGVTAAKNTGFKAAGGNWVIFLDSDDILIPDAAEPVLRALDESQSRPIVFFRCMGQDGRLVGRHFADVQHLTLERYGRYSSHGEALVAINKAMVGVAPFDEDLRGYEGLGCARIIKRYGAALLYPIVARCYRRSRPDRLSAPRGFFARAHLLGIGHVRYIGVLDDHLSIGQRFLLWVKALVYMAIGAFYSLVRRLRCLKLGLRC
jgi:glycosyltransferase involved in cell wall biosynthesis